MELQTMNCPECGSIFRRNPRNLCQNCSSDKDRKLDFCTDYLWKHPQATTEELSNAAGIEYAQVAHWVKARKFSYTYANLTYPCESCRHPIGEGRLCHNCHQSITETAQQIARRLPRRHTFSIAQQARY
ncbi:hypothetical protein [Paenibacillus massiliensis]|uniref:hypothetical protein n=1 Tax=Paenibacillus massiliensis TaxID=225917 RepID=UPI00047114E8|nr:hypothetical protein [Paenibacillus massiliensis]